MSQPKSSKKTGAAAALIAAVLAATVAFVAPWEGGVERGVAKPYRDIVGVWTVCYGDTAVPMREYTAAECKQMLGTRLGRDLDQLGECIAGPVSTNQMAAILSLAYNAGVPSICRSTLVRQLNSGQPPQVWCQQFDRWVYAGGRKVRGLVNRRAAEKELCLK